MGIRKRPFEWLFLHRIPHTQFLTKASVGIYLTILKGGVQMKYIQIITGYLSLYSVISLTICLINTFFAFIVFLFFILALKIIPHPISTRNPFAFGLRLRRIHWENQ